MDKIAEISMDRNIMHKWNKIFVVKFKVRSFSKKKRAIRKKKIFETTRVTFPPISRRYEKLSTNSEKLTKSRSKHSSVSKVKDEDIFGSQFKEH
jgi:hypothetical protein